MLLALAAGVAQPAFAVEASSNEITWGVNGHPFTAYPGVTPQEQVDQIAALKARSYRVDVTRTDVADRLAELLDIAAKQHIEILPVLIPPLDLKTDSPEDLRRKSAAFAEFFVRRFPQVKVWELGNEMENFAIILPCEMRDDGTQYPCAWGPAGGMGVLDYYGPRYQKVAAVLRGLGEGVHAANPAAQRAIGSAGWGHVGFHQRLHDDGIPWEKTVWHWYDDDPEWALKYLVRYGKPIWITEFNHPFGSQKDGEDGQAKGLVEKIELLKRLAGPYNVEAAHIYELLDESYWQPSFEAHMGLVGLERGPEGKGWRLGAPKAAHEAVRKAIESK